MRAGLPGLRVPGLAIDALEHARVQGEGRLQQALELDRRAEAGDLLEDLVHVAADVGSAVSRPKSVYTRAVPLW
jgi:hypothetical protein